VASTLREPRRDGVPRCLPGKRSVWGGHWYPLLGRARLKPRSSSFHPASRNRHTDIRRAATSDRSASLQYRRPGQRLLRLGRM